MANSSPAPPPDRLCIHPAKVKEVRQWLADLRLASARAPRLLVLSGPVASGKTALLRSLCAELAWRVEEYACPAALDTHAARMTHFIEWVHHAARYASLGSQEQTLYVIEDAPEHRTSDDAQRTRDALAGAAARMQLHGAASGAPALTLVSSDGGELDRVNATDGVLAACGVGQWPQPWALHVKLNRPTEKMLAKMLVATSLAVPNASQRPPAAKRRRGAALSRATTSAATTAAADAAAAAADGDIRRALFLFGETSAPSGAAARGTSDKRLDLFHLLGKVMYNKRAPAAAAAAESDAMQRNAARWDAALAEKLRRPPTLVDVPLVLSCCTASNARTAAEERLELHAATPRAGGAAAELTPGSLALFMHENAPHFVTDSPGQGIDAYAKVMAHLSDAIHMTRAPPHQRGDARDALWDASAGAELNGGAVGAGGAGNVKEACACAVAVLGYMHANDAPAPRSWRPLRAPEHYAVARARRDNMRSLRRLMVRSNLGAADAACDSLPMVRVLARSWVADAQRALPTDWAAATVETQRGGDTVLVVRSTGSGGGGAPLVAPQPWLSSSGEGALNDDIEED